MKTLVVYFSRKGYVKKIAEEKAKECGGDILELKTSYAQKGGSAFGGADVLRCTVGKCRLKSMPLTFRNTISLLYVLRYGYSIYALPYGAL